MALKEVVDAAQQSAVQFKATKIAMVKARAEEQANQEKEEIRLAKEEKKLRLKAEKEKEKAAQKEKTRLEKESKKKNQQKEKDEQEDRSEEEKDKENSKAATRRGKGLNELGEGDPAVLTSKFPNNQVQVCTDLDDFLLSLTHGMPAIWRMKRSVIKKILEHVPDISRSELSAMNRTFLGQIDSFISDFAEKIEAPCQSMYGLVGVDILDLTALTTGIGIRKLKIKS